MVDYFVHNFAQLTVSMTIIMRKTYLNIKTTNYK